MSTESPITGKVVTEAIGPRGDTLTLAAAAKLLGVSPRRARTLALEAGRLEVTQPKPLRVSRASVEVLLTERTAAGIEKAENLPTVKLDPEQLATLTQHNTQLAEAMAALIVQVGELRADLTATRNELTTERAQRLELEATPTPRRRWWQGKTRE
jgi:hypothetical protein